jgi:hypothetical protein
VDITRLHESDGEGFVIFAGIGGNDEEFGGVGG